MHTNTFTFEPKVVAKRQLINTEAILKNLNEKFTHFRYKEHPGDLFRGTVIVTLPDPYKDQENFWIWFHSVNGK